MTADEPWFAMLRLSIGQATSTDGTPVTELLTAGQQARQLAAPFPQPRKHVEHGLLGPEHLSRLGRARGDDEVLAHSEALEDAPALRHQGDALRGDLFGRQARHGRAEHLDRARAGRQQADGDIHARGLAGAVAADETEHAAFAGLE